MRVLELDELLTRLAVDDTRAARVAEMRLFGGMEQEQIARVLGVSRMTVTTDWQFARAWLADQYKGPVHG
jgi:DNA-binding transcriptional regulator LsrR (DeoR family)